VIKWQQHQNKEGGNSLGSCPKCRAEIEEDLGRVLIERALFLQEFSEISGVYGLTEQISFRQEATLIADWLIEDDEEQMMIAYYLKARTLLGQEHTSKEDAATAIDLVDTFISLDEELSNFLEQPSACSDEPRWWWSFEIYMTKCKAYELLKDWHSALNLYRKILINMKEKGVTMILEGMLREQCARLHLNYARCLYEAGNYDEAIDCCDFLIFSVRFYPTVRKYKAQSLMKLGRFEEAITTMNQALLYDQPGPCVDTEQSAVHLQEMWKLYNECLSLREN
jgi:tetratricopeptide (TPR) repeat protein